MNNKLVLLILGCVVVVILMIVGMMVSPVLSGITGQPDTEYTSLFISGTPISQLAILKVIGLAFGLCTVSIFLLAVAIGAQKKRSKHQKQVNKTLIVGAVLYLGVYLWMVLSWWDYTETNSFEYVLGLPKPTAIQMFGLLFIPAFLSFFYITKFDAWVYSDEDEAKFKEILKRRTINTPN